LEIPLETRRLFPGYANAANTDLAAGLPFLIARLLEDGDEADLRWLTRNVPETDLAAWLEQRGGRQLSVRSRAFWEAVLDRQAGGEVPARKDLWPL
jgi:hypothetical protein